MGKRKRSRSKDSDYRSMRKKVKKLERKLQHYRRSSSSSSTDRSYYESLPYLEEANDINVTGEEIPDEVDNLRTDVPVPSEPVATSAATEDTSDLVPPEKTEEVLDPEILLMLGEDPTTQKEYGDDLHKDIAARWAHILINGLPKESKSELMKHYLPAENCSSMKAPKLNLEIEAALSAINVKKDLFSQNKQNQLSCCLAAIGNVLNWALSASKDTLPQAQEIIKPLSDAGRLLCDCHYRESQSRRYAIINNLNKQTRDVVKNTNIGESLFGANLAEHLKSSKAISKSGLEMKSTMQRAPYKPPTTQNHRGALNARGVPRAAAGEPRQYPAPRRPAAAPRDRRPDSYRQNRTHSVRQRTRRR